MPVYPLLFAPVVRSGSYPHMAKHDATIWEKFLDEWGANFEGVAYDVALGGLELDPSFGAEDERLGWRYSTALKVDAVAQRAGETWVIEVRPHASVSAIGAALCYVTLAEIDELTPYPLVPAVVTDAASSDIKLCAERLGVTLVETGPVT